MLLLALGVLLVAPVVLLAVLLSAQPVVPAQLPGWPSLGFLYLQLLRSAVKGKQPPTSLQGKPIKVTQAYLMMIVNVVIVLGIAAALLLVTASKNMKQQLHPAPSMGRG